MPVVLQRDRAAGPMEEMATSSVEETAEVVVGVLVSIEQSTESRLASSSPQAVEGRRVFGPVVMAEQPGGLGMGQRLRSIMMQ